MMNKVMLGLAATAVLVVGTTNGQAPRAQDPATEIADLKRQVARLSADVNFLKQASAAAGEAEQQVEQVVAYLEAQSKAAAALEQVLAESEVLGFTWGINPESREVMLAGFNDFYDTLQSNVPGDHKDDQ